jgi:hypothetical protein
LGKSVFEGCKNLTNINFVDSEITYIPDKAFLNCTSLRNIVLPDSVQTINANAFGGVGFKNILFSDEKQMIEKTLYISLNSNLSIIRNNAFEIDKFATNGAVNTTNILEEVSLPSKFTFTLDDYNFLLSSKLKKVNLHEDISNIKNENNVITLGTSLIRVLSLNETNEKIELLDLSSIEYVYSYAFYKCGIVDEVKFGNALPGHGIEPGAFYESDIKKVDLGNTNVQKLYEYTFNNMSLLNEVILPQNGSLTTLGHHLFVNCPNLTSIILPNSITTLEIDSKNAAYTFSNCGVETLVMPDNKEINGGAKKIITECNSLVNVVLPSYFKFHTQGEVIDNCENLKEVTLPIFTYTNNDNENVELNTALASGKYQYVVNCPKLEKYILNSKDNREKYIDNENGAIYLKNSGETLEVFLVPYNADDYERYLIDGVISIGQRAFLNTKIKSFIANDNILNIGDYAFNDCTELTTVVLGKNVTNISSHIFENCSSLENIIILGDIVTIGTFAFCSCGKLNKILLLSSIVPKFVNLGEITNIEDIPGTYSYMYHPFGYRKNNLAGLSSNSENICYLPYKYDESLSDYNNISEWQTPLFNENLCNFTKKVLTLNSETNSDYITLNVYKDGQIYTDTIYLKSDSGNLIFKENGSTYSSTRSLNAPEGHKIHFDDNVYHDEPIYIYSDSECTNMIGEFIAKYGINEYVIGMPSKSRMRMSTAFNTTMEPNAEVEMANITKKEYESLLSRVNQMAEIISKLKK